MKDMNILKEIENFKRLSGLLTESVGGLVAKLRNIAPDFFDDLIGPAVRAGDSQIDNIARKIERSGISSLADNELIYLISKLPADKVAKKLVDGNVFFSPTNVGRLRQEYLNKLTRGDMTWDEIILQMQNGKRTIWGQSPNIPDNVYDDISNVMDEVTQRYIDDVEDFIRKNGSDDAIKKLPKSVTETVDGLLDKFPNWLKNSISTVRPIIDRLTKNLDTINKEKDEVFKAISSKISKDGASANIKSEVRRLTELATAAKRNNDLTAKEVLDRWLSEQSQVSRLDRQQFFSKDEWYNTWQKLIDDEANKTYFQSYLDAWSKLNPFKQITKNGVTRPRGLAETKEWITRTLNLLVYASPYTRKELAARMAAKGVAPVVARRMASHFILYSIYWPAIYSVWEWGKQWAEGGDKQTLAELIWKNIKDTILENGVVINPASWTHLDSAWALLTTTSKESREAWDENNEILIDAKKAEEILKGEYTPNEEDSNTAKSNGVRKYIKNKYSDIPADYLPRIHVGSNNRAYFTQITGGGRTNIPLALINGEIYLINRQANKKIKFDKIWTTINEGLINLLSEQEIDWGSGEPIDGSVDLDNMDDVTTSDWSEIFGGDDNSTQGTTSDDSNQGGGLSNILNGGGSGSSSTVGKLKFSSDTESINIAKNEAKQDADDYTNDHISIEDKSTSPTNQDRVVLVGKTLNKTDHFFPVEKNSSGKYGWIDDSPEGDGEWNDFTQY